MYNRSIKYFYYILQNIVEIFNGPIIQLSTDYVFDGKAGQYNENSSVNPINVYGRTKLEAENFLKENSKDSLIIRTNVLYDYVSSHSHTKHSF